MSIEKFLQELDLPVNADIDQVESVFIARLKERLQHIVDNYNEADLQAEDKMLRGLLTLYFAYTEDWVGKEKSKYGDTRQFDTAPKIKKEAEPVVRELQDYMKEFTTCYMQLNRFMTLLREEIGAEEIRLAKLAAQKIKWTADSGIVIARHRKEKKRLLARMDRISEARPLLQQIETDLETVKSAALTLFGKAKADPYLRSLTSGARTANIQKAQNVLQEMAAAKKRFGLDQKTAQQNTAAITAAGTRLIETVQKNEALLLSDDKKLFLRPVEADMAYNADIRELQKIKAFLAKYHLPYMEYKLNALQHLKDKLLVINTLDSLFTLYKRLVMGIARPLKDIKAVRFYESEIVNHSKYLLSGHFTELPKILQRAEETVEEFRASRRELEEFDELRLEEIAIREDQPAQA